jgi:3-deoxy-manno-octulosonate cytidylyltransferase (CMP-KDO synthetase)
MAISTLTSFVVIPARLHSTRLATKMLLKETGKSLVQHTYEASCAARKPVGVCVATEDEEIAREVRRFGGCVVMTPTGIASGTDRVAAAAADPLLAEIDVLINVQGDEPEIDGAAIDQLIELMESDHETSMATLAAPIRRRELIDDPACVKVVLDDHGRALYFSRSAIPHARQWDDALLTVEPPLYYQHMGIYAYRREMLLAFSRMPRTALEQVECLEQLRVVQAGVRIAVGVVPTAMPGIDTPADYAAFVARHKVRKSA